MSHQRQTAAGLSLIEILIACLLSVVLIRALSSLIITITQHTTAQQQHTLLLQHSWLIERILSHAIAHAGFSAAYPADFNAWQGLNYYPPLQLYQYSSEALPTLLPTHWLKKLLKPSTLLESTSMEQGQFVQQHNANSILIHSQPLAHVGDQWLLTHPSAWQLLRIDKIEHHAPYQWLHFSTQLKLELLSPLLASEYHHQLWFIALNGQISPRGIAQYGLYRWNIGKDTSPQEIVSGITAWHGQIIATKKTANGISTLIEWHFTLSEGNQSLAQVLYILNTNLH